MSFREVDEIIDRCLTISVEAVKAAKSADRLMHEVLASAREAADCAEIASIYSGAEAELQNQALDLRRWEMKLNRKARLFDRGAIR
jgi:hypothetical protein